MTDPQSPDLHRFLFSGLPVRGAMVRLTESWREALDCRAEAGAFPAPVRALLGEMTAAGVLMQSSIKFDGALVLQLHGDGPVKLAVAEVRSNLRFRSTAKITDAVAADASLEELVNVAGNGRCAITLDPAGRPEGTLPYQGVVPLHGDHREPLSAFSQVLEHYMLQSEQLDTRLVLAANDEVAAGLLLQRMPAAGAAGSEADEAQIGRNEDFNRIAHLAATLTRDELLELDVDTVLHRLFWDEPVVRFEPQGTRFACSCDGGRVQRMLVGLGRAELDEIIEERGSIEVACDFCGRQYRYGATDVRDMFGDAGPAPGETIH
ncbi:MAG: Hsp33 family molecular chaperone HslO [Gammaproteobacteria bacterium]